MSRFGTLQSSSVTIAWTNCNLLSSIGTNPVDKETITVEYWHELSSIGTKLSSSCPGRVEKSVYVVEYKLTCRVLAQ